MEWVDEGIVLGVKRHGETSVILELMTHEHGRHLGLVRGGGRRACGRAAAGNLVRATGGRGSTSISGIIRSRGSNLRVAGVLAAAHALYGVTHLAALCRLLAEREPHAAITPRSRRSSTCSTLRPRRRR